MGNIGDEPKREIELEPFPETAPVEPKREQPATPEPAPAEPEKVPA
jgi:hypothetical protein